jgi:hypothetical protein
MVGGTTYVRHGVKFAAEPADGQICWRPLSLRCHRECALGMMRAAVLAAAVLMLAACSSTPAHHAVHHTRSAPATPSEYQLGYTEGQAANASITSTGASGGALKADCEVEYIAGDYGSGPPAYLQGYDKACYGG